MAIVVNNPRNTQVTTYGEFLKEQERRLTRIFRQNQVKNKGIASSDLPEREDCYYIGLQYSPQDHQRIHLLSQEIAARVPAYVYQPQDLHVTLANGYITPGGFTTDNEIIRKLGEIVESLADRPAPRMVYPGLLFNETTTIMPAYADRAFFDLAHTIHTKAKEEGLELNFPWGAHMSISRFTTQRSPEELTDLFSFIEQAEPIGEVTANRVSFGVAERRVILREYGYMRFSA
ncbi:hypothetical protein HYZ97_03335 [Candidatus Pacearchaeota archaeon]|nr:hypothetical protein [Candidatus Pacearchaeota archaeon]